MDSDDELFENACHLFDNRAYFEAHEVWEELWHNATGPRHAYLQGLIQLAAALHHASHGNYNGMRKLFASAIGYLDKGSSAAIEIDLECLKAKILEFDTQVALGTRDESLPWFALPRAMNSKV